MYEYPISIVKSHTTTGVLLLVVVLFCSSCAKNISGFYPEIIPRKTTANLAVNPNGKSTVSLTYLGAGDMIIEKDGEAILTDPFFSNQKFLKMIGKVQTRDDMYDLWKSRVEAQASKSSVRAALVSHTHYDHVMDLPTLLQSNYFSKMEAVYGNSYLPQMMVNFNKDGVRIEGLSNEQIFQPAISNDNAYQWIQVSPKIRFLAIESNHAPHTKRKLYQSKPLDAEYFKNALIWPNSRIKTRKWTVGTTYAFLVDFIQKDTLRMYIQTSASQYPYGAPPKDELKKKKIDVAVLCYASTNNVKDYPKAIVKDINPSKMIIVHWEDFFRDSKTDEDVLLVRKTNPKKARRRFDELGKKKDFFMMPRPGTKIDITY
jgi:Beta-lactamase superfamily domain